ncbi:hypothetical protein L6452_15844 [Arctium lappa]|uniref:Uncharacterized protein n=1 Tax=Arctium lappa TaxID=4217 RepID=A0ACB9CPW8_ARCLA|nr:hypothetical protein L6452_15844 [Arctium lappa]
MWSSSSIYTHKHTYTIITFSERKSISRERNTHTHHPKYTPPLPPPHLVNSVVIRRTNQTCYLAPVACHFSSLGFG